MKGGDAKPEGAKISVMLKKYSRDAGRFWKVSFLYAKMGKKTGRDGFSVYR